MFTIDEHYNGSAVGSPRIPAYCAALCLVAATSTQSAEGGYGAVVALPTTAYLHLVRVHGRTYLYMYM